MQFKCRVTRHHQLLPSFISTARVSTMEKYRVKRVFIERHQWLMSKEGQGLFMDRYP